MQPWLDDLSEYLDHLEATSEELDATVQTARSLTRDGAFAALPEATAALQIGLGELEAAIERRRELLDHSAAPPECYSLRQALRQVAQRADHQAAATHLLERCEAIGQQMDQVREAALSLFVCQYHLADTTSHFLRLMLPGTERTETYGRGPTRSHGGGLLDKAG
ncbi:hypothetical protein [Roseimaritima sediminicola]|uniref:hypothetical protein n=1 Tax=Roseimaritima sediminicola TaxID=2662066 RepID=UPI0012983143|nr:hypothetical protein [Roseimaritima sediminicola]